MTDTANEKPSDFELCPDQDMSYRALFLLLPPGRAFGTRPFYSERTTNIKKFIYGIAGTWAKLETALCNSLNDWFCFTSVDDADRWATDYGVPDDCDLYNASVCAKVSASNPPTAQYLMSLLEANGYVGEGRWLTGKDAEYPGVRSTFRVVIDTELSPVYTARTEVPFPLDQDRTLGYPDINQVACMLNRYIPAHTIADAIEAGAWEPITGLGTDLISWWSADDTAGGLVSSWASRGVVVTATGAGATRPQSHLINPGNGLYRFVSFDTTDFMDIASLTGLLTGTTPGELWGLVQQTATSGSLRTAFSYGDGVYYRGLDVQPIGPDMRFSPHMGVSFADETTNFTGLAVIGARHTGTKLHGRINGIKTTPEFLTDATLNTPTTRGRIGAGSNNTAGQFWNGDVRHIFVTKPLTETKALRLEAWMAHNVRMSSILSGDHPYRNIRP